ncbi:phospholipid/cholesterol/gamma-HCH transport system permease protein [Desulfatibacillum alkenivorans DSM 16219]|jgi:phospholipid/cholesterol/gamma-HCH transport system permease protein|uniref:Phospholipid/cholesterol/gamma-HCH transport system permease protein n=1 Tax=Desulfatibacillum alkenivorans DSM 16219 TaxID=1121393 RepID=A0A1M6RPT5_9BACT|nr:ABC transporter permease [Desulfatibacillum alkenivorans]SHK34434.1 phospholipid/cholesterol/gamma-HCH transport system permease protein [Desulfatibacillum alkenivorans DSM 16219]
MSVFAGVVVEPVSATGRKTIAFIQEMGRMFIFLMHSVLHMFTLPLQFVKIITQINIIGAQSLYVVSLIGLFTGMVLGLQLYNALANFGSEGMLGTSIVHTLIKEMGPVLAAIMVTARAGSAMAAEIGIMRISEEIDALDTMQINPIRFLVSPRLAAAIISFPLLTALFDVIALFGGYLSGCKLKGLNDATYWYTVENSLVMEDINGGFLKAIVFAVIVITVCCYQGYTTHMRPNGFGAKGVSASTTSAVVMSCVLILMADFVLTAFIW